MPEKANLYPLTNGLSLQGEWSHGHNMQMNLGESSLPSLVAPAMHKKGAQAEQRLTRGCAHERSELEVMHNECHFALTWKLWHLLTSPVVPWLWRTGPCLQAPC
mmetsp:Transcript_5828/g.11909  ORF Transcript_5828/g.11909 Transcript_5828/m.11909 type:complete len:104 (+) Transcript_5828:67-378(+)